MTYEGKGFKRQEGFRIETIFPSKLIEVLEEKKRNTGMDLSKQAKSAVEKALGKTAAEVKIPGPVPNKFDSAPRRRGFTLSYKLAKRLDKVSKDTGISKSEILRRVLAKQAGRKK